MLPLVIGGEVAVRPLMKLVWYLPTFEVRSSGRAFVFVLGMVKAARVKQLILGQDGIRCLVLVCSKRCGCVRKQELIGDRVSFVGHYCKDQSRLEKYQIQIAMFL